MNIITGHDDGSKCAVRQTLKCFDKRRERIMAVFVKRISRFEQNYLASDINLWRYLFCGKSSVLHKKFQFEIVMNNQMPQCVFERPIM